METCCCCFGYGPPQTPFEAMHRQEMERRRIVAKEEKYRKSQYQKALQESHRLSLVQSNKNTASIANANPNSSTTIAAATTTGASNNNAAQ